MEKLTILKLCREAKQFAREISKDNEPSLLGVTDGKAVGTYLEHKFQEKLDNKYSYEKGNTAKGIDFPELKVDIKVTSIKQPQSSCPFKSARQKIYGLGYSLMVFIYDKTDNMNSKTSKLNILHTIFVEADRTSDYQLTRLLREMIENNKKGSNLGLKDDILALFEDKNLPLDNIQADELADEILKTRPNQGYLTISNALQWRLQYSRLIEVAGNVTGVKKIG